MDAALAGQVHEDHETLGRRPKERDGSLRSLGPASETLSTRNNVPFGLRHRPDDLAVHQADPLVGAVAGALDDLMTKTLMLL